jgi:hypothetical protein
LQAECYATSQRLKESPDVVARRRRLCCGVPRPWRFARTTTMRWKEEAQLHVVERTAEAEILELRKQAVLKIYCVDKARSLSRGIQTRRNCSVAAWIR